jgi:L-ascorbate metabolism protein UlaG (beta-lactamase superfamily)
MLRIAHSTLLLKIDGRFILTDPVFSETITPFGIFAPKRFHELPITIEELPFIDIVVISHNHYDHLDEPSIKKLKDKVGHFYTTLGIKQKLLDLGVDTMKVCELDWWQSCVNETIRLRATPAQHFSGRSLFDRDKTLWSSWVITSSNTNIFFSGDTGYFNTFKEIGEKYGPFDITFLEAGAYNERWKEIHMMPKETVQAHLDLKGKILFPIHNSSFKLSLHAWNEPLEKVVDEANKKDIQITHPKFGEIISIEKFQNTKKWW